VASRLVRRALTRGIRLTRRLAGSIVDPLPILRTVNAIARFESLMESLVERGFSRLLRTRMQPVEVAKRLSREMESHRTVAINHVLVPNRYVAALSAQDFDQFSSLRATLQKEMASYLMEYAAERSYTLPGSAQVTLERDAQLRAGGIRVSSRLEDPADDAPVGTSPLLPARQAPEPEAAPPAEPSPAEPSLVSRGRARLDLQGASCYVDIDVAAIGRGLDNDVVVEDPRVSRHHARLQRSGRGWELVDLSSTNGTFINDKPIRQRPVANGDTISLGGLEMTFHVDAAKR
jgi:hypothetical protein